jgi:hypothetical protein
MFMKKSNKCLHFLKDFIYEFDIIDYSEIPAVLYIFELFNY